MNATQKLSFLPLLFPSLDAFFGLQIKLSRFLCWSTQVTDGLDDHGHFYSAAFNSKLIPQLYNHGWFYALAVAVNLATAYRLGGHGSGLEKPGGPQPLVESDFMIFHD